MNNSPMALLYMALIASCLAVARSDTVPCPRSCHCAMWNVGDVYSNIIKVDCAQRGLTAVPDLKPLAESPNPKDLRLNINVIRNISRADFPPNMNIVSLDISSNIGMKIAKHAFINLGYSLKEINIEAVDLAFNKTLEMFNELSSLGKLNLDHNNKYKYTPGAVRDVNATMFKGKVTKSLKKLSLAFCRMVSMSYNTLEGLTNLEDLNLSNNWFTFIPSTVWYLSNLRSIEMFFCKLMLLVDDSLLLLSRVEKIDFSFNNFLERIEKKSFAGLENSLTELNLKHCGLKEFPSAGLLNMNKLKKLDVSSNKFEQLGKGSMVGKYKLTELVISSPKLKFDSNTFDGQEKNIIDLSIPSMNLKTIPTKYLKKLTNLNRLSLEYNSITRLPEGAFEGLTATSIRLDNNPLSYIAPGAFKGLPPNIVISLRRTKMADVSFLRGYIRPAIHTVNLEYSKLVCGCSLSKYKDVVKLVTHLFGSCTDYGEEHHFSSTSFGYVSAMACERQNKMGAASDNGNRVSVRLDVLVSSLGCAMMWKLSENY